MQGPLAEGTETGDKVLLFSLQCHTPAMIAMATAKCYSMANCGHMLNQAEVTVRWWEVILVLSMVCDLYPPCYTWSGA